MTNPPPAQSEYPMLNAMMATPVLGWLLREALFSGTGPAVWGAATLAILLFLGVIIWGYAALISVYLLLTAAAFGLILAISRA